MDLLLARLRGNDSLSSEFELSFLVIEALVVFLDPILWLVLSASIFFWLDFQRKIIIIHKQFIGIDNADFLEWDVWGFVLESTMHKDVVIRCPACVAESLH